MEDIIIYLKKVLFYFVWTSPVFLIELDSVIGFHFSWWEKFKKTIDKEKRKRISRSLLVLGFIVANYLVFHDTKIELRGIKKDFETYKNEYSLKKSEMEERDRKIIRKLLEIYGEGSTYIDYQIPSQDRQSLEDYELKVNKWTSDSSAWIDQTIGYGAREKFFNRSERDAPRWQDDLDTRYTKIIIQLKANLLGLQELIESNKWWNK